MIRRSIEKTHTNVSSLYHKKQIGLIKISIVALWLFICKDWLFVGFFQYLGLQAYDAKKVSYILFFCSFIAFSYYVVSLNGVAIVKKIKVCILEIDIKSAMYLVSLGTCLAFMEISFLAIQTTFFSFFDVYWFDFFIKENVLHPNNNLGSLANGYISISTSLFIFVRMILVPIVEEIFFRGFVQLELSTKLGRVGALFISSAIFTIFHDQFCYFSVFISSLIFGYIFLKTNNLVNSIVIHSITNLFLWLQDGFGVFIFYTSKKQETLSEVGTWKLEILLFILLTPVLLFLINKIVERHDFTQGK